jgi:uncharacterized protein YcaQ
MALTLDQLRSYAVARSLFAPTSLASALERMGFVQADPIRAPARAQDLILRHRVSGYRAGDLERLYATLDIEEDSFINYGFVTRGLYALMHPRRNVVAWSARDGRRARALLAFIREHGPVHPRDLDEQFRHGAVTNYWGGLSKATTHLLDQMHYRGLVRVAGRTDGTRTYVAQEKAVPAVSRAERTQRIDRLVDVLVRTYAPLSLRGLATVVRRLRYAAPQWQSELTSALVRAKTRLAMSHTDGVQWFWPADESPQSGTAPEGVRLLTPFDPIVWDRGRFELFWNWEYRFEAYTPLAKRVRGYYALPLLWRSHVIGWANVTLDNGSIRPTFGYATGAPPRAREFRRSLDEELERLRAFLDVSGPERGRRRRQQLLGSV